MENFAKPRCRLGMYFDNVRQISVRNVRIEGAEGEALLADHYEKLEKDHFCEG